MKTAEGNKVFKQPFFTLNQSNEKEIVFEFEAPKHKEHLE
jgi:drug/metabolite transporter (DMT)-like permease